MAELWFPGAQRWPGNSAVTGYLPPLGQRAPKRGAVLHSAEGSNWDVIHNLLLTKSWHLTIGYDRVEQHHSLDVNCWHGADTDDDNAVRANIDLIGIEALGVAGEALTAYQREQEVELNRWCAAQFGRSTFHRFDGWDPDEAGVWVLAEHNEVSNTYTACPSGRIPWPRILAALEDTVDDQARLWMAVAALFGEAASYALRGRPLPAALKAQIKYLVA